MTNAAPTPSDLASAALSAFERVVAATPGFRARLGQHAMAECIATSLSQVDLGDHPAPQSAIAVIQAGTGVGKSAAYASTAIAMALARKTRVLISTATVALQEQLMQKDLPALAATLGLPFDYALAKGRGRYVCKLKLERLVGDGATEDDFFEDEGQDRHLRVAMHGDTEARRERLYGSMATLLAQAQWDGDRDTLPQAPDPLDWAGVAAERHSCTARHCPRYKDCSYYNARSRLAQAQVIVANHDLVLASLGMKTLPELDNCLVIFDEGHHLPAVALDQFSSSMDLSRLRWLDVLPKAMQEVATKLNLHLGSEVQTVCSQLKTALTDLARLAMELVLAGGADQRSGYQGAQGGDRAGRSAMDSASGPSKYTEGPGADGSVRFAHGVLPTGLAEPLAHILAQASGLSTTLEALGAEVKAIAKDDPSRATQCATLYAKLGTLAPRLGSVLSTSTLLLEHGAQPLAKWLQAQTDGGYVNLSAHACPTVPGDLLLQFLWSRVRGAVVTSASLTSCGSFDYFLQEAGLAQLPQVKTLAVPSPFDYATQGTLTVVHTRADPKQAQAYTAEMVAALVQDLRTVQRGALVLFTSRAQMRAATEALPEDLRSHVLVQGSQSRMRLLASHAEHVAAGMPSIVFGMQSFGEGLDLPGALCETVFITKLPFTPPSEPVDEARAEWLRSLGRDPFNELVVPATGIKLLQWTGRAIRTEDDRARVICYDKRLLLQAYGRRMLAGLPPYRLEERRA